MTMTCQIICQWTNGSLIQGTGNAVVKFLLLDSRKSIQPEEGLFIAIHGVRHNSHLVIPELYAKGIRAFLVDEKIDLSQCPEADVVLVKDSIDALQKLAGAKRSNFNIPIIGITGSNGKTTVKEWLNVLLSDDYRIVRSPKSYNSQIGVPLSVWNIDGADELGIFEAGISQPGEMENLAKIIRPNIGILTSIGSAHMEHFLSKRQLIGEKLHLFAPAETIIVPDDADVLQLLGPWMQQKKLLVVPKLDWTQTGENGQHSIIRLGGEPNVFLVPFSDKASLENVAICIVCMRHLGYADDTINERLTRLSALEMRLQLLEGENGAVIVNDAYSNDLQSLEIALEFLSRHARGKEKAIVLSDFVQSGIPLDEQLLAVVRLLQQYGVERWYSIGPDGPPQHPIFGDGYAHFQSTEEFLAEIDLSIFQQTAVLIKGARHFTFEKIIAALQDQTHDTVLQIDLGALVHNLNYFKAKLAPTTKLMVMVKAFGYGIGAPQVASLLMFNKVDYLAVAYTDEGVALRKAGISLPVMVMNPERNSLQALIKYKLEPEIYSFNSLQRFTAALAVGGFKGVYPIHLKLDTGMHRLGFGEGDIPALMDVLQNNVSLRVASIFTHLVGTDNPDLDAFTNNQLLLFQQWSQILCEPLADKPILHVLNTGGIQRFPNAQFDMVRLGIGLYGVAAHESEQKELLPVNILKTVISQIKVIKAGDSIGYNRAFVANQQLRSATIPLGYADGLRRSLSNGKGSVWINGQLAPIVGNVCMDMTMVDVTDIPCEEGDMVEIFGHHIPIQSFAIQCQTIAYEVLTSISQRVKRIYSQE
jgi:Alr-MurF fusion protein